MIKIVINPFHHESKLLSFELTHAARITSKLFGFTVICASSTFHFLHLHKNFKNFRIKFEFLSSRSLEVFWNNQSFQCQQLEIPITASLPWKEEMEFLQIHWQQSKQIYNRKQINVEKQKKSEKMIKLKFTQQKCSGDLLLVAFAHCQWQW